MTLTDRERADFSSQVELFREQFHLTVLDEQRVREGKKKAKLEPTSGLTFQPGGSKNLSDSPEEHCEVNLAMRSF